MAKRIFNIRGALLLAVLALLTTNVLMWSTRPSSSSTKESPIRWDEELSKNLAAEFHRIHVAWNNGDIATVKNLIAGDDVLVTFELADDHTPVPLRSKQEIDAFFDRLVKESVDQHGTYVLEMPKMNCRASSNFGVCTEECTIHYKVNDTERIDSFFGTAVAVKFTDGWKWIQYHMSVAGPSRTYRSGKLVD